jgi:hypothetical protein
VELACQRRRDGESFLVGDMSGKDFIDDPEQGGDLIMLHIQTLAKPKHPEEPS